MKLNRRNVVTAFIYLAFLCFSTATLASAPLWTFTPLTATNLSIPANGTATVQYIVTNQSTKIHTISLQAIAGITQLTTGLGVCGNPFTLRGKASCTLSLQVNGSQLTSSLHDGPNVCEQGSALQCYRPAAGDILQVTQAPPITTATLSVTGSPLALTSSGVTGTLTINNTSSNITAINISSYFTGTALDGKVTETGNTCSSVPPLGSCTLTYTPGCLPVSQTNFPIQGSNTNAVTAAIQISDSITLTNVSPSSGSASGGTGVTLTGSGLTGATGVTFGGIAATSVNVVNSTTVTAVTPADATGTVDVVITTPSGSATDTNSFTYLTSAVGQSAYGGIIACLNGSLNNLIAATADNSSGILWGSNVATGASSMTNGATKTATIITALGEATPIAATLCGDYEIDSQGNSPCEAGNTCYNDWFLPAGNNTASSGQLNCLYTNRTEIGGFSGSSYWSSTEVSANFAYGQNFTSGSQSSLIKNLTIPVRCVRSFSP